MPSTSRVFIPRDQIVPGKTYVGYVATPDGLLHHTHARTTGHVSTGDSTWRPYERTERIDWGVEPNRKRTPQERAESLARRIWSQVTKVGALPDDVFREVQQEAWENGETITFEQARQLAAAYLTKAEKLWEEEQGRHVVRQSPHVLDPGSGKQGA